MPCRTVVPPYILAALSRHESPHVRNAAVLALEATRSMQLRRAVPARSRPVGEHRLVYDCRHERTLPGRPRRREGQEPCGDADADRAYDAAGTVLRFWRDVFGRNSIDDRGMHLIASVHFGEHYDNAFWDGRQMVYGDGDGVVFGPFTSALDIIAHELAHGVIDTEAALVYHGESGALAESIADVFGTLAKQWSRNQTVGEADWLIGSGLFTSAVHGFGLRSLAAPGSAYDDPVLGGKDPQGSHLRHYVHTLKDDGGVHLNSGIPNHAFYRFAKHLGGHAWKTAARVWYDALRSGLSERCSFAEFATATVVAAAPHGHAAVTALERAWVSVGIRMRSASGLATAANYAKGPPPGRVVVASSSICPWAWPGRCPGPRPW